jgi:hypothetical protein
MCSIPVFPSPVIQFRSVLRCPCPTDQVTGPTDLHHVTCVPNELQHPLGPSSCERLPVAHAIQTCTFQGVSLSLAGYQCLASSGFRRTIQRRNCQGRKYMDIKSTRPKTLWAGKPDFKVRMLNVNPMHNGPEKASRVHSPRGGGSSKPWGFFQLRLEPSCFVFPAVRNEYTCQNESNRQVYCMPDGAPSHRQRTLNGRKDKEEVEATERQQLAQTRRSATSRQGRKPGQLLNKAKHRHQNGMTLW